MLVFRNKYVDTNHTEKQLNKKAPHKFICVDIKFILVMGSSQRTDVEDFKKLATD